MVGDYNKHILKGLIASGSLLAFYLVITSLLGGISFALDNFVKLWYWMTPLIIGFGIQIGMFFYIKDEMHKRATTQAAASTGISATSMVACCAHHIADIAPFLGITALGLFLTKYQSTFLLIGIFSNILGIIYMLSLVNTKISKTKIKILFYSILILSIIFVLLSYFYITKSKGINGKITDTNSNSKKNIFISEINNENNVEFKVTPLSASEFQIEINTHSVDLGFDLTQISVLYDDLGNEYAPLRWEGSPPGSHHRSGILIFPTIDDSAKLINLVITDSAERKFTWSLK